jgi:hypothetical protein
VERSKKRARRLEFRCFIQSGLREERVDEPIQSSTLELEIFDLNSQEEYSDF